MQVRDTRGTMWDMWKITTLCQILLVQIPITVGLSICTLSVSVYAVHDPVTTLVKLSTNHPLLALSSACMLCCSTCTWMALVTKYLHKHWRKFMHQKCSTTGCRGMVTVLKLITDTNMYIPQCDPCARKPITTLCSPLAVPEPSEAPLRLRVPRNDGGEVDQPIPRHVPAAGVAMAAQPQCSKQSASMVA